MRNLCCFLGDSGRNLVPMDPWQGGAEDPAGPERKVKMAKILELICQSSKEKGPRFNNRLMQLFLGSNKKDVREKWLEFSFFILATTMSLVPPEDTHKQKEYIYIFNSVTSYVKNWFTQLFFSSPSQGICQMAIMCWCWQTMMNKIVSLLLTNSQSRGQRESPLIPHDKCYGRTENNSCFLLSAFSVVESE